ncbi:MAG: response regulator [Desulfobacteraceae bacterium]|nr:response regulator [Desulfobacteraceae bacterium]
MRILIVDDKASVRSAMKRILTTLGLKDVIEAEDGKEALQKLNESIQEKSQSGFNLVISDMEMPNMSGLELLRSVRNNNILKEIPFIMVTTVTARDIIIEVMRLGIQAYIIKPFNIGTVALKLKQAGII